MSLLTLKDIGKIYVSDSNVAVGIRGVNLSFDRGEFVAITGKSGSGKSTLLNVISGMDSYEEGELYIDGESTSHYMQPEWEEYREKYISFIFQDYNIIESFTVLQNVELALMHIDDKKERRARALELLERVGMTSHIKQKGSKLSGGQKQRTVIARALAKDSPIILADEPTGNLDSVTSKEIIELLYEVSREKLVIIVTHNFEQVEEYATRHIRIFDGAVESDHIISSHNKIEKNVDTTSKGTLSSKASEIKKGLTLGKAIFTSKPKLSVFLCLLMIIGALGIFMVTSLCGDAKFLFSDHNMFNHMDGRVIITKQNGEVITDDELKGLVEKFSANNYIHYDVLLDEGDFTAIEYRVDGLHHRTITNITYGVEFKDGIIGEYPKAENEVLLYLPIYLQPYFGKDAIELDTVSFHSMDLKVTGIKYYYDNNLIPKCIMTREGFNIATAVHYLSRGDFRVGIDIHSINGYEDARFEYHDIIPSFNIEKGKIHICSDEYEKIILSNKNSDYEIMVEFTSSYEKIDYYSDSPIEHYLINKKYYSDSLNQNYVPTETSYVLNNRGGIVVSTTLCQEMANELLFDSYKQASIFFKNDKDASNAIQGLKDAGYIAVMSDTTYVPDASSTILNVLLSVLLVFAWFMAILFLAFFINLCSSRAISAFKNDMAIMRSMGIPVRIIHISMYVRMLISLVPAFICVILMAILIFTSPKFNGFFSYLYAWQYAIIFMGMLILTINITYKQIKSLFKESVKKSLKGGNAE